MNNAREIEAARALGDLRENAEFKAALERRARLQSELKFLSDQIGKARILTPEDVVAERWESAPSFIAAIQRENISASLF